jgi:hypothetical protein
MDWDTILRIAAIVGIGGFVVWFVVALLAYRKMAKSYDDQMAKRFRDWP